MDGDCCSRSLSLKAIHTWHNLTNNAAYTFYMYCLHCLLILFIIWYIVYLVWERHGNILFYDFGYVLSTVPAQQIVRVLCMYYIVVEECSTIYDVFRSWTCSYFIVFIGVKVEIVYSTVQKHKLRLSKGDLIRLDGEVAGCALVWSKGTYNRCGGQGYKLISPWKTRDVQVLKEYRYIKSHYDGVIDSLW